MKYNLLAIDLDGTLLNSFKKISSDNLNAINEYIKFGGKIAIVTGRTINSGIKYLNKIEDFTQNHNEAMACFNGAYIVNRKTNKIYEQTISNTLAYSLLEISKDYKVGFWAYTKNNSQNGIITSHGIHFKTLFSLLARALFGSKSIKKIKKNENLESYKINLLSFSRKKIKSVYEFLISRYGEFYDVAFTSKNLIEITKKGINKGYAIEVLSKINGINSSEITAFGDSFNDVPIFKKVGQSIAIKPANDNVYRYATNSIMFKKNAVSYGIYKYVLNRQNCINPKIDMVVSDLDGTLLDNKTKQVDLYSKEIIRKLDLFNIPFVIATGRNIYDAIKVYESIGLKNQNTYMLGCNGSLIYDYKNKTYLKIFAFKKYQAENIFNEIKNFEKNSDVKLGFFVQDNSTTAFVYNKVFLEQHLSKKYPGFLKNQLTTSSFKEINTTISLNNIVKFVIHFDDEKYISKCQKYLWKKFNDIDFTSSTDHNLEIMVKNVSKGEAINYICNVNKILPKKTLVIGDAINDESMFKITDFSATYKLANRRIVKKANYVFNTKESLIVGEAIKSILFI